MAALRAACLPACLPACVLTHVRVRSLSLLDDGKSIVVSFNVTLVSPHSPAQTESRALEGCDVVTRCDSVRSPTTSAKSEQQQRQQEQQQPARETHSCPSSPTETDCSSGFSTLRKRSVTLTEKVEEEYIITILMEKRERKGGNVRTLCICTYADH